MKHHSALGVSAELTLNVSAHEAMVITIPEGHRVELTTESVSERDAPPQLVITVVATPRAHAAPVELRNVTR